MMKKLLLTISIAMVLSFVSEFSQATVVRPLHVQELTNSSAYIIKAKVVESELADDTIEAKTLVRYYTLQILDVLKGDLKSGDRYILKQIGQGEHTVGGYRMRRNLFLPEYQTGSTYLFFLPSPHAQTGFSTPVGLWQGVYKIKASETPRKESVSGFSKLLRQSARLEKRAQSTSTKFKSLVLSQDKTNETYQQVKNTLQNFLK